MSNKRSAHRAATLLMKNFLEYSDSNSEDEATMGLTFIHLMQTTLMESRRKSLTPKRNRRTKKPAPKKKIPATTCRPRKNKAENIEVSEVCNVDSNYNENTTPVSILATVNDAHQKDIENKVNNFFQSGKLLSDDEEDELLALPKNVVSKAATVSKAFYVLSDSDDDLPSTSAVKNDSIEPIVIEDVADNTDKELMEIVDKILDGDNAIEVNTSIKEPDNWNEFKSKADAILGSVTALLDTLKYDKDKTKEEKATKEKSPVKSKPTCPVCLEVLDGNIVPGATICGHIFCMRCIKKVVKTSKTCPTCRKRITLKQIHPLYL